MGAKNNYFSVQPELIQAINIFLYDCCFGFFFLSTFGKAVWLFLALLIPLHPWGFFQYACNVQYACNNTDIDYDYVTQHHKLHDCMLICEVYFNLLLTAAYYLVSRLMITTLYLYSPVENKCIFKYIQGSTSSVKAISPTIYIFNPYAAVSDKENFQFEIMGEMYKKLNMTSYNSGVMFFSKAYFTSWQATPWVFSTRRDPLGIFYCR